MCKFRTRPFAFSFAFVRVRKPPCNFMTYDRPRQGPPGNVSRAAMLEGLGARDVLLESPDLCKRVRERNPEGIDAVLDIVGNTTILDSLAMLRRGGHACLVGFLGGGGPLALEPVFQIPTGTHLSVFAIPLRTGTPPFPLSRLPFHANFHPPPDGPY